MMTDEEISEEVHEEEIFVEILEPPSTFTKIKPDTAFNGLNTGLKKTMHLPPKKFLNRHYRLQINKPRLRIISR